VVPQIPYRAVEVNPLTKAELKWGPHRHVPVALLDQEVLADSSAIVSRLAAEAEGARAARQPGSGRKGLFRRTEAKPPSAPQASPASLGEPDLAP
jgi:glutathione S-transferase